MRTVASFCFYDEDPFWTVAEVYYYIPYGTMKGSCCNLFILTPGNWECN